MPTSSTATGSRKADARTSAPSCWIRRLGPRAPAPFSAPGANDEECPRSGPTSRLWHVPCWIKQETHGGSPHFMLNTSRMRRPRRPRTRPRLCRARTLPDALMASTRVDASRIAIAMSPEPRRAPHSRPSSIEQASPRSALSADVVSQLIIRGNIRDSLSCRARCCW